ncbi:cytochrome c oxidase subunit II [Sandarakinorhabdus sp.]|uniref:cytochrome c oxidase subunit II n=1 Tax=Sandarakinorhabdus sp. TaxID=1916663 RepID=UPI00286E4B49|nr:cytochrome c oxidase subunit II [Sandarakinorhabdus sp.]
MMRIFQRLSICLLLSLSALPAMAQSDPPAAAPVAAVATTDVPASVPAMTKAVPGIGQPDGRIGLQTQVTALGQEAQTLTDSILNPLMAAVAIFVLALLGYTVFRFRAGANPVPSKTTHNTTIEVVWTLIPVLILVGIAVPSFRLLANQYDPPKADLTIKATGHQWYWEYEYQDQGGFSFDSVMLTDAESATRGSPKLLDVDNRIVVPAGATVKILTTAADVIHSFAIPAFWVKMDAVPGRTNETWFKVDKPGVYFGQCSELCGTKHGFMPIAVEVLPRAQFDAWVAAKKKENGIVEPVATAAAPVAPAVTAAPAPAPAA